MTKSIVIADVDRASMEELLEAQRVIGYALRVKRKGLRIEPANELQPRAERYGFSVKISPRHTNSSKRPQKYQHPENKHLTF